MIKTKLLTSSWLQVQNNLSLIINVALHEQNKYKYLKASIVKPFFCLQDPLAEDA